MTMQPRRALVLFTLAFSAWGLIAASAVPPSPGLQPPASAERPRAFASMSRAERIRAMTAIERVYYNHRIWPKENAGQKPSFDQLMPAEQIEAKVNDLLKKSAALETLWRHPVTAQMLQAEMERMAIGTKDPRTLQELFAALGNDPRLIAQTLARQTLVDRLIRNWYAADRSLHAGARRRAEALALRSGEPDWAALDGEYTRRVIVRNPAKELQGAFPHGGVTEAGDEEFADLARRLPAPGIAVPLQETTDGFYLQRRRAATGDRLEMETLRVPKISFERWWESSSRGLKPAETAGEEAGLFRPVSVSLSTACNEWLSGSGYNNAPPPGRIGHSAVWTGSEMIVWGGYDQTITTQVYNTGGRYNPATDSWSQTPTGENAPEARTRHTAVWTGSEMIIWGGSGYFNDINSGARYNPATGLWRPTAIDAYTPTARRFHSVVWTGGEMIVWGGADFSGFVNSGSRYSAASDSWQATALDSNVPLPRINHTAVWTGSRMMVWGGWDFSGATTVFNDGGRYDPVLDAWSTIDTAGADVPSARYGHGAVWTGSVMVVWGGRDGVSFPSTGGQYNPATDSWLPTSLSFVPNPRINFTAIWTGSRMIVWGGGYNSGGKYDPVNDDWTPTSTTGNVPNRRDSHSAVWTGSEMIIWGGQACYGGTPCVTETGGRYNPTTDNWLATPIGATIPAARSGHTAIWTGSEMIIWGGGGSNTGYLDTGGRYVSALDSWTPTPQLGAPSPRAGHSAIWDGTKMIIWGGYEPGTGEVNTGARYNPAGDSWSPVEAGAGVPDVRAGHTAVWTGAEMIIWGGSYFSGGQSYYLDSGGRYSPTTGLWNALTVNSAPDARNEHTAVWTGIEMIIWGGNGAAGLLGTGGRYRPAQDSWTVTDSSAASPTARRFHTAVWTGAEMIVWGGFNGSMTLATGARYEPALDRWFPTATGAGLPTGRLLYPAIWTGAEMIVWGGGSSGIGDVDTGGRYSLSADRWLPTSIGRDRPEARSGHSAIWDGSQTLVWGGNSFGFQNTYFNTGGIYVSGSVASPGNSLRGRKTGSVGFSWASVNGAGSYNVQRCNANTVACIPGTVVSSPTLNQYGEPNDGNSYFYTVEAVNSCGSTP